MSRQEFANSPYDAVKDAILQAGVMQTGHFELANGGHALKKIEMDRLWENPGALAFVLGQLAQAPGLPTADVLLGVPTGGSRLAEAVAAQYLAIPLARLERVPNGAKQDFQFCTVYDRNLAVAAHSPRIIEDVVTSGSSVHGVVRLLNPEAQDIHAISVWQRNHILPAYHSGVTHHSLIEEHIPVFQPNQCPHCTNLQT